MGSHCAYSQVSSGNWLPCQLSAPAPAPAPAPQLQPSFNLTTISGEECVLPLDYDGEAVTGCMELEDRQQCWTAGEVWEPCAPMPVPQVTDPHHNNDIAIQTKRMLHEHG